MSTSRRSQSLLRSQSRAKWGGSMLRHTPRTQSLLETKRKKMKDKKLCNWWNGEFKDHSYGSCRNLLNFAIFIAWFVALIESFSYIYSLYEEPKKSMFSFGASKLVPFIIDTKLSYVPLMIAIKTNAVTLTVIKNFVFACPLGTAVIFIILNSLFSYVLGIFQ